VLLLFVLPKIFGSTGPKEECKENVYQGTWNVTKVNCKIRYVYNQIGKLLLPVYLANKVNPSWALKHEISGSNGGDCDMTPCNRVINFSEERSATAYSEYGDRKCILNVGKQLLDYTISHPWRGCISLLILCTWLNISSPSGLKVLE
jgi:hypothetical protein